MHITQVHTICWSLNGGAARIVYRLWLNGLKKPQPMDEHRFERRNRNRKTMILEILESSA